MQLPDALLALFLKRLCIRREIGVFIAEQLIGDLTGHQHADIRRLMDGLADEIHAHRSADGRDVICAQSIDDILQRIDHFLAGHEDLGMIRMQVFRHFPRIAQIDRVFIHADRERANRPLQHARADGAHQRGIQSAAEQKAKGRIGVQTLAHPFA